MREDNLFRGGVMRSHGHVTINAKKCLLPPGIIGLGYGQQQNQRRLSAFFPRLHTPTLLVRNNTEDSVSVDIAVPQVIKSCINRGVH